ncbi:MAG: hypothetical protein QOH25_1894 [Acidobacteriota bacterium]|jgi:hypothetical protein|nr:hypothetical protein [Acidobacteriota bacterium]
MPTAEDLFTQRKSLDEICAVPEKIISVYSLEKHVWADSNSEAGRKARKPELQTIEEFQIDPVRPFLNDVLRNMAAPYNPERRDQSIGQGYWIQAEFGSGKSHLLCFLSALALGSKEAWKIVDQKERKAERGKRESIFRFWEEGLEAKSSKGKKGVFVIVKTLVGAGGGAIGLNEQGQRLTEYILEAAREQLRFELGKNISLYPSELLADRFIAKDLDLYRPKLKKFLRDPNYWEEDEFEDVDDFIREMQENKTPDYKQSCGNKLWRFYTEYLEVSPQIVAETEDVLKHMVEAIMAEGYSGVLLVLDEVSLFMKNRGQELRDDDEITLVVLSNRLAKIHHLPIWTICAAQQAIESRMGVKNIIADDRLKLVELLKDDKDYYDIVLARVREIKNPSAIKNYYLHYKRGFTWPNAIGEEEFAHFFPFHKPAIEVLRDVTHELTTARSAIHFMHQTLKHQVKNKGRDLVRLWELFDEAVRYEEDPSGVHAGLVAIRQKREDEYRAYEACKRQIDGLTRGYLKVYRDKAVKTVQTLFLYHVARSRQQGLTPEEIANSVLIEREDAQNPDENIQHYESIAENLKKELRQIAQSFDEEHRPRYRFDPVVTGVDPRNEFRKAKDEAEANQAMRQEAWDHLLALDEWPVRTRQMTLDLSSGVKSIFRDIAPFVAPWEDRFTARTGDQSLEVVWQGRAITGLIGMRDLSRVAAEGLALPPIDSDQTDRDFAVFIGAKPASPQEVGRLVAVRKDPRILFWTPGDLTVEERDRLHDFAAYRKLISDWQGKDTEDALAVINWVANALQTEMGKILKIVDNSYARGRIDALDNSEMDFHVAGELSSILAPLVDRVLSGSYESRDIKFDPPFVFRKEEGVKVINGIVKTGRIPKNAKPNQNISAAQNFGLGLKIVRRGADKELDTSENPYVRDLWEFIDEKLADERTPMKVETLYKNFMGMGGPKDYGLTRRMAQIYLLCLVQQGKIRISVGPRSGLSAPIDYANIAEIDFSTRILDTLNEAQKMAQPENWEVLRPYAEKLLEEPIPSTHDDSIISSHRAKIRELFAKERDSSRRMVSKAASLFETLKATNPYDAELTQVSKLFESDLEGGDDINLLLYSLKEVFGYQAFDANAPAQTEVDDLANRLKNYRDLQKLLEYETELRTAHTYCAQTLPDLPDLKGVRKRQRKLCDKLADLRPFIDSDVQLKTDLIGRTPPESGETGTLGALIQEYTTVYSALHDSVIESLDTAREEVRQLLESRDLAALRLLERVSALQPAVSDRISAQLISLAENIPTCDSASRASVEEQLKANPIHECGLDFNNADAWLKAGEQAVAEAPALFDATFNRKIEIFLNPAIRERLQQGSAEPLIASLLQFDEITALRTFLVESVLKDDALIDVINRYLKKITVKRVRLADFKPSISTVEMEQIPRIAREFREYLEDQLRSVDGDDNTLLMLQVE